MFFDSENDIICNKTLSTNISYRQLIRSLMYLAILICPDIDFCVNFLNKFNDCYTNVHWQYVKRVLQSYKRLLLKIC